MKLKFTLFKRHVFFAILSLLMVSAAESSMTTGASFQVDLKKQSPNKWIEVLTLTCSARDATCELVCQNKSICELPQLACVDCVGQTNRLLQTIFRNLSSVFVSDSTRAMTSIDMVEHLRHSRFLALPHDSHLNVFTPKKIDENKKAFNSLCPNSTALTGDTLLLMELDQNQAATKVSHVICQYQDGAQLLEVRFNPLFTPVQYNQLDAPSVNLN